jgi:hypothetical protein
MGNNQAATIQQSIYLLARFSVRAQLEANQPEMLDTYVGHTTNKNDAVLGFRARRPKVLPEFRPEITTLSGWEGVPNSVRL